MQLASGMAAIASRGMRMRPAMLKAYEDPRTKERVEPAAKLLQEIATRDKRHWDLLFGHLMGVVHGPRGTASGIGRTAPYHIAGKTGTAQVKSIAQGARYDEHGTPERLRDHALFIAFAPVEDPKVAIAVIVENGSHGSTTAAPIARLVLDQLLLGGPADGRKAAPAPPPAAPAIEDQE
jgi:penicillin-binding protein 2